MHPCPFLSAAHMPRMVCVWASGRRPPQWRRHAEPDSTRRRHATTHQHLARTETAKSHGASGGQVARTHPRISEAVSHTSTRWPRGLLRARSHRHRLVALGAPSWRQLRGALNPSSYWTRSWASPLSARERPPTPWRARSSRPPDRSAARRSSGTRAAPTSRPAAAS